MNAPGDVPPTPPHRIGVTLGDPRGIGPEVVAKALRDPLVADMADLVVIGPEMPGHAPPDVAIGSWSPDGGVAAAGALAGAAVERAIRMAMAGEIDAIATAPIDKSAFRAGGWDFPGHTEMLRDLTGAPAVGMLMASEGIGGGRSLRVVLATIHLALREVPDALTGPLLEEQARLADEALRAWWDVPSPRLAFCALNPHASDGGLFGNEEARVYAPAIARLRGAGLDVTGPLPADTVFVRALRGEFDVVIAPYHDVGMAAFKTASFGAGVNVTLGLPFPRTSPDHGTALDIAGRGVASPGSMVEAIRLAARLAARARTGAART
jgi:4-hydroxythreonine-4-phosphate dehydrogenase